MRGFSFAFVFIAAGSLWAQTGTFHNPVRGVVTSGKPFSIGAVEEKPESGPIVIVDGDRITADASAVMFRLTGENRAVLGIHSAASIRPYREEGAYFYLSAGSIQYEVAAQDASQPLHPLAICARDRLYVPSIPGSGEVAIHDNKVQVTLASGTMVRSGEEVCDAKAPPVWLTNESGTGLSAGAGTGTATATATATAAGVGSVAPAAVAIGIASAAAAGLVGGTLAAQAPAPQSVTTPGQ